MTRKSKSTDPLVPTMNERQNEKQGWVDAPKLTAAERLESVISVRFDADATALIRRAAVLQGGSRSDFVRAASIREAQRVINEHETRSVQITRVDTPTFAISSERAVTGASSAREAGETEEGSRSKSRSARPKPVHAE